MSQYKVDCSASVIRDMDGSALLLPALTQAHELNRLLYGFNATNCCCTRMTVRGVSGLLFDAPAA